MDWIDNLVNLVIQFISFTFYAKNSFTFPFFLDTNIQYDNVKLILWFFNYYNFVQIIVSFFTTFYIFKENNSFKMTAST